MMVGNGQWVTTRDEKSVGLFLADIEMRRSLERQWEQGRRAFLQSLWHRVRRSLHRPHRSRHASR